MSWSSRNMIDNNIVSNNNIGITIEDSSFLDGQNIVRRNNIDGNTVGFTYIK